MTPLDDLRRGRAGLQRDLIDRYADGTISRRELVRRGTVLGLGLPFLGALVAACGSSGKKGSSSSTAASEPPASAATTAPPAASATAPGSTASPGPAGTTVAGVAVPQGPLIRVALPAPAGDDPLAMADAASIAAVQQVGEHLVWTENDLSLRPVLAERWAPNDDGTEWTFLLHEGITTHAGAPLTAQDVVDVFERIPARSGEAPEARSLRQVLPAGGVGAADARTLVFRLDRAVTDFPYLLSQVSPESIVLPGRESGDWTGTGPFRLARHAPGEGTSFARYDAYWNQERAPLLAGVELSYHADAEAMLAALRAGQVDLVHELAYAGARNLLDEPELQLLSARTAAHRQIHMRADTAPFDDLRVRRALALLVDRDALLERLFDFQADTGSDTPFAPVYPVADVEAVPPGRDVEQARALLAEAGAAALRLELTVPEALEMPALAELLVAQLAEGGVQVQVRTVDREAYLGSGSAGAPRWLEVPFGIVDQPHRPTPNALLLAGYTSDGAWNAARFADETCDELIRQYDASLSDEERLPIAREIEQRLHAAAPVIVPYFPSVLRAASVRVSGVEASPWGSLDLTQATTADAG